MSKRLLQRTGAPALTVSLVASGAVLAARPTPSGAIRQLEGEAFATAGRRRMYLESHGLYANGSPLSRLVLYRSPDGQPFARKLVRDDGNTQAPDLELDDGRTGYREGVRQRGDQRRVFVRKQTGALERSEVLDTAPAPAIDAGFDACRRMHRGRLGNGSTETAPLMIPRHLDSPAVRVPRLDDTRANGHAARRYRLGLFSWIGLALPHTDVTFDAHTRELLHFVGTANMRGTHGDNVHARIRSTHRGHAT